MTELDRAGRSELHHAAVDGTPERVRELIDAGADVALADRGGMTPLHFTGQQDRPEIAAILLAAGAPVDAQDDHGNTALWKAVFGYRGSGELIALLRDAGADPRRVNGHDVSPLTLARRIGSTDVARHFADLDDE